MSGNINEIIDNIQNSERMTNTAKESVIDNLLKELDNLKIVMSTKDIDISSSASKLASVMGGMIKCSFGIAPGSYLSIRATTLITNKPSSNISDSKIGANVVPFAGCTSPTNPFFKPPFIIPPLPCIPLLSPFVPTSPTILLENMPITTKDSIAMCTFAPGGMISFSDSGQTTVKTS